MNYTTSLITEIVNKIEDIEWLDYKFCPDHILTFSCSISSNKHLEDSTIILVANGLIDSIGSIIEQFKDTHKILYPRLILQPGYSEESDLNMIIKIGIKKKEYK